MSAAPSPVPTSGNSGQSLGIMARRLVLLDRARVALGGAEKLADILGISRRAVNHKLSADRALAGAEMRAVADAVDARAAELVQLAANLREVAG